MRRCDDADEIVPALGAREELLERGERFGVRRDRARGRGSSPCAASSTLPSRSSIARERIQ